MIKLGVFQQPLAHLPKAHADLSQVKNIRKSPLPGLVDQPTQLRCGEVVEISWHAKLAPETVDSPTRKHRKHFNK